jgi:transketolase
MKGVMSGREAYGLALRDLGARRGDFVVLEGDLSESTRTKYFAEAYPERFIDCGCAEMNMMGMAAGLAASGILPIANTFSVFTSMKTCEQVRTFMCYPNLNVKLVATHAGLDVGEAGVTHQATEDVAIMRAFPNMVIIQPADAAETRAALNAMVESQGPAYMRLGRSDLPKLFGDDYRFVIGRAMPLRDGGDVTILGTGITVGFALDAAELLAQRGISAGVINMSTLKPIDREAILRAAQNSAALVTVEDHTVIGGLGSAVLEALAETPRVPVLRLGLQDVFGQSGKPMELFAHYGIDGQGIAQATESFLVRTNRRRQPALT